MRRRVIDCGDLGRSGSNTSSQTRTGSQTGTARTCGPSSAGCSPGTSAAGCTYRTTRRTRSASATGCPHSTSATRSPHRAAGALSAASSCIPCTAGSLWTAGVRTAPADANSRTVRSADCASASTGDRRPNGRSPGRRDPATDAATASAAVERPDWQCTRCRDPTADAATTSAAVERSDRKCTRRRDPTAGAGTLWAVRRPAPASRTGHGIESLIAGNAEPRSVWRALASQRPGHSATKCRSSHRSTGSAS